MKTVVINALEKSIKYAKDEFDKYSLQAVRFAEYISKQNRKNQNMPIEVCDVSEQLKDCDYGLIRRTVFRELRIDGIIVASWSIAWIESDVEIKDLRGIDEVIALHDVLLVLEVLDESDEY